MPKSLLLADDSITIQKVVGITFAQEDFEITYVDNGEDAIQKAKEIKPDIVLADIIMPQKNGYEVCEAIKTDASIATTPVLLLAGTFETFDETRGKNAGADGYIIKPFESQALIDKVMDLVSGKGSAPAIETPVPQSTPAPQPPITPEPQVAPTPPVVEPQPQFVSPTPPSAPSQPEFPDLPTSPEIKPEQLQDVFPSPSLEEQVPKGPSISEEIPIPDLVTIPPTPMAAPGESPVLSSNPLEVDKRMEPMLEFDAPKVDPPLSQEMPVESISLPASDPDKNTDLASSAEFMMDENQISDVEHKSEAPPQPPTFDFVSGESDLAPETRAPDPNSVSFPDLDSPLDQPVGSTVDSGFPNLDLAEASAPRIDESVSAPFPSEADVRSAHEKSDELTAPPVAVIPPKETPLDAPVDASTKLSDAQMEELVRKVSQSVIEKIAWDVVPEVAERIVKEEIKRLTDNTG